MKYVNIAIYMLILLLTVVTNSDAQKKYAIFIHGFEGGAESWTVPGTPDQWVSDGIVDGYINFTYETSDLASTSKQATLIARLVSEMNKRDRRGDARWVIVAHSMGGLVARLGYDAIKSNFRTRNLNIEAIITLGSPHQGARIAEVSLQRRSGYRYIKPDLDNFRNRVELPLKNQSWLVRTATWYRHGSSALQQLDEAPVLLDLAYEELKEWDKISVNNDAKGKIGLQGDVVRRVRNVRHEPRHKRSIIGAEKKYVIVRAASEMKNLEGGSEYRTVQAYDGLRSYYKANSDAYSRLEEYMSLVAKYAFLPSARSQARTNAREAKRKKDRWNAGHNALTNIDNTWNKVINSYKEVTGTRTIFVRDSGCYESSIVRFTSCSVQRVTVTYTYLVPTKTDGVVGPEYAVWNRGDRTNDRNVNWLYDDRPAAGGYNHFELRRYKRGYTLPGVFRKGDYAPPLREAALWTRDTVLRN